MSQVGEKYFFVSPSNQRGGDFLRTLTGNFWTWDDGLMLDWEAAPIVMTDIPHPRLTALINFHVPININMRANMQKLNAAEREKLFQATKTGVSAGDYFQLGTAYETTKTNNYYVFPRDKAKPKTPYRMPSSA